MKTNIVGLSLLALLSVSIFSCKGKKEEKMQESSMVKTEKTIEERVDSIVNAMTVEEKIKTVMGTGMPGVDVSDGFKLIPNFVDTGKVPGAAGRSFVIERLGLKEITFSDGPAGIRMKPFTQNEKSAKYATAFPIGTALSTTWNTELVNEVGKAMGDEVKEYGVDILLAPALNIHRNPLTGRNFEYYSEDPLLTGKITSSMVQGIQSNGVGTSVKHFAANNQERNRTKVDALVSERAMREIYLRGFEIAVREAQPWTVMSSYNKLNGTFTSARHDLLTQVLRDEWGFKGFVMTDWFGGYENIGADAGKGSSDVVAQMTAGNDMLMPGVPAQEKALKEAIENKTLPMEVLDQNVKRILYIYLQTPTMQGYAYSDKPDLKAHAEVTRRAATEGMVLLKNENQTLPLTDKNHSVAVFGVGSYAYISGGTGSGDVEEAYTINLIQGLENAGYKLDEELKNIYVPFAAQVKATEDEKIAKEGAFAVRKNYPEMAVKNELITKKAKENTLAIISIRRISGEGTDREVEGDFNLSAQEQKLITEVSKAFHKEGKKVVVILNIGGVVETASWKNNADAILLAWQSGQEGGNSIADILSGKANPSGKLPMTFPMKYTDTPFAINWTGLPANDPTTVEYKDGVYVGYRYFNSFGVKPSYEFGYGLSYTTFSISDIKLSSSSFKDEITATVKVTNTGKVAGKEVVQLYLSAPAVLIDKPTSELKAFAKTKLLAAGESQEISLTLKAKDLASFVEVQNAWVAEAGTYTVQVGNSSLNIAQKADFSLENQQIVEKVKKAFSLAKPLQELSTKK